MDAVDMKAILQGLLDLCKFTGFTWDGVYEEYWSKTSNPNIGIRIFIDEYRDEVVIRANGLSEDEASALKSMMGGLQTYSDDWEREISLGDPDLSRKFADTVNNITFHAATRFQRINDRS